jgi:MFS family permease
MNFVPAESGPPELETPPPTAKVGVWRLAAMTVPSFAYTFTVTTLAFVLLPDESRVFPYEPSWILGLFYFVGGCSELPGPMLGHLSDSLRTPFGRRRPLLLACAVGIVCATTAQWTAAIRRSLLLFALSLLVQMLFWTLLYAANQGLVLDTLRSDELPMASSCQAFHVALGACFAFLCSALLPWNPHFLYGVTMVVTLMSTTLAVIATEEAPLQSRPPEPHPMFSLRWIAGFYKLDFEKHPEFSLVMLCKVVMYGAGIAKGYLVYYLRDTWGVTDVGELHSKVASIAISAELCAAVTAGFFVVLAKHESSHASVSPEAAAVTGALVVAVSWACLLPISFTTSGFHLTELFGVLYGLGHGCVMYGDNALTYKHVPSKEHGAQAFGLQSVAAFVGFGVFSVLASATLDVFGRRLPYRFPGPRAAPTPPDGYRLEGYIVLFVLVVATNLVWAHLYSKLRKA